MKSVIIRDEDGKLLIHLKKIKTGVDSKIESALNPYISVKVVMQNGEVFKFGQLKRR